MKKHWTILMLPALLLTLAACGVEHPTLEDGTGVSVTLGEAVRLDTPDQLTVYPLTVDADQAKADIERAFGITLAQLLELEEEPPFPQEAIRDTDIAAQSRAANSLFFIGIILSGGGRRGPSQEVFRLRRRVDPPRCRNLFTMSV